MMAQQTALFEGAHQQPADTHANRGMSLEAHVAEMHEIYAATGLARIDKQFPQTLPMKDGRWAKIIGRSTVDYVGVLKGGRMVAFDAKDCREDKIELKRLQDHQRIYLDEVKALGGMAFVLVRFEWQHVYAVPIRAWDYAIAAYCAPGTADTMALNGWRPSGKAHIKRAELPGEWAVNGFDWYGTVVLR